LHADIVQLIFFQENFPFLPLVVFFGSLHSKPDQFTSYSFQQTHASIQFIDFMTSHSRNLTQPASGTTNAVEYNTVAGDFECEKGNKAPSIIHQWVQRLTA
jgi:hypothetical protein